MIRLQLSGVNDNDVRVNDSIQPMQLEVRDITPEEVIYGPKVKL
jgi:hypothetical protein